MSWQYIKIFNKNGKLIFTVPIDDFSKNLFFNFLGPWYPQYRNKKLNNTHLYNENKWQEILMEHGLLVDCTRGYMDARSLKIWDLLAFLRKLPLGELIIRVLYPLGLSYIIKFLYQSDNLKTQQP